MNLWLRFVFELCTEAVTFVPFSLADMVFFFFVHFFFFFLALLFLGYFNVLGECYW